MLSHKSVSGIKEIKYIFKTLNWHDQGTSGEDIKILRILEHARGRREGEGYRTAERGSGLHRSETGTEIGHGVRPGPGHVHRMRPVLFVSTEEGMDRFGRISKGPGAETQCLKEERWAEAAGGPARTLISQGEGNSVGW